MMNWLTEVVRKNSKGTRALAAPVRCAASIAASGSPKNTKPQGIASNAD
jgi:hypothetical protein